MKKLFFSLLAVGVVAAGCASGPTTDETATEPNAAETTDTTADGMAEMDDMAEMASSSEGDYEFTLMSPEQMASGDAEILFAVADAETGEPVETENLTVEVYMPEMEDMEKMSAESEVEPGSEPGTYKVKTYLGMAGPWVTHAVVEEGEKEGTGHLMFEAQ